MAGWSCWRAEGRLDDFVDHIGAAVWAAFRVNLIEFVLSNGGQATLPRLVSGRDSWNAVVARLGLAVEV